MAKYMYVIEAIVDPTSLCSNQERPAEKKKRREVTRTERKINPHLAGLFPGRITALTEGEN